MTTDTSEKDLETLIVGSLICDAGYQPGRPEDYDRDHAVDAAKLLAFLRATQPDALAASGIEADGPKIEPLPTVSRRRPSPHASASRRGFFLGWC